MTDSTVRVLLVDDHALIRAGNALVIEATDDLEVVGEAGTGEAAVSLARSLRPDVVLMDVRMPGMGGIEATRQITAAHTDTRVLVLTTFDRDEYAYGSLRAGASAFLLKSATPDRLTDAIRTVAVGDSVLDPRITRTMIETFIVADHRPSAASQPDPLTVLSPREIDVFVGVAEGLTNTEIAARLVLSVPTVKTHVNRILSKLHARDRVHLVILGYENRMISSSR
ncbi:response regulator transcription factor [Agromyces atrinae]|uniref:response regulator n=1 Tax=Agromyces atrinae TaxID=592376 RepID=UPI001F5A4C2F|nr:response regulator transcription factor [Agromyces atrinae]MCI2958450.1 response regulator transcription factor [Agromyces atrinae]